MSSGELVFRCLFCSEIITEHLGNEESTGQCDLCKVLYVIAGSNGTIQQKEQINFDSIYALSGDINITRIQVECNNDDTREIVFLWAKDELLSPLTVSKILKINKQDAIEGNGSLTRRVISTARGGFQIGDIAISRSSVYRQLLSVLPEHKATIRIDVEQSG